MNVVYLKNSKPKPTKESSKVATVLAYATIAPLAIVFAPIIATWAMLARYGCQHTWVPINEARQQCIHCKKKQVRRVLLGTERVL